MSYQYATDGVPQGKEGFLLGKVWFLDELDIYKTVKPYRLRFDSPDPSVARTNITNKQATVRVIDLRNYCGPLSYERNGFTMLEAPSVLTAEDCTDALKIKELYLQGLKVVLSGFFATPHVVMLEYVVLLLVPVSRLCICNMRTDSETRRVFSYLTWRGLQR